MAFAIDEKNRVSVFDSYDQEVKLLTADHDIQFVKRYYIDERSIEEQHRNILKKFISFLNNYVLKLIKDSVSVGWQLVQETFRTRN